MSARVGDLDVVYPRFFSVPGVLKTRDGAALERAVRGALAAMPEFRPDAIDANLGYPDGVGVLPIAKELEIPAGITLRGVDVNEFPDIDPEGRGELIRRALREADAVFPVSDALRIRALELGSDPLRTVTVRNGVDTDQFRPRSQLEARRACGLPPGGRLILSVGHLSPRKRFDALIEALAILRAEGGHDDVRLAIIGGPGLEGDTGPELRAAIARYGLGASVILAGPRTHEELAPWYNAADVFALASLLEGRPNVVLEAAASGLPVVAARVWGLPELVPDERFGLLVSERGTPVELAIALKKALGARWDRSKIAEHAAASTWDGAAKALVARYELLGAGGVTSRRWVRKAA
ncbi:MAG TPA: glycosyltransferase [Planctomycetota bacterium]|nr:glycosyltransferase [Planctomycetota bacterium]